MKKIYLVPLIVFLFVGCSMVTNSDEVKSEDLKVTYKWEQRTEYFIPGGWLYGGVDIDYSIENKGDNTFKSYEVTFGVEFQDGYESKETIKGHNLLEGDIAKSTVVIYAHDNLPAESAYVINKKVK